MSVAAQTNLHDPTQVYDFTVHGIDMSDDPEHQLEDFFDFIHAVTSNLQHGNTNFNKDRPCAVCGQSGYGFDKCSFLAEHEKVHEAYLQTRVALNHFFFFGP